ncbi:MAG: type VI secretion system baseplate subunit TssG [Acidobacteriota bacterium]
MAAYGWRKDRGLTTGLVREGHLFSFVQAVRLLEALHPDRPELGTPDDVPFLRLRARVGFDFRPGAIDRIELPRAAGEPFELTANFFALAGIEAPLPTYVGERLVDRVFRGDSALRDFLDLFHHRLLSLWYGARKKHRPTAWRGGPDATPMSRVFFAVAGFGQPSLRGRLSAPDRSLLLYTGLLAGPRRSLTGLERMLAHDFGVPVDVVPFQGGWIPLAESDVTRLGQQNHALVTGAPVRTPAGYVPAAVLGRRAWRQDAGLRIEIGPLGIDLFRSLLPGGRAHDRLLDLVRVYAGDTIEVSLRLVVRAAERPPAHLGDPGSARLGYCSWVQSTPLRLHDGVVTLRLGRHADRTSDHPTDEDHHGQ